MSKLKKPFLKGSFYSECKQWLTNGHWAIRVNAYPLPESWEINQNRGNPDMSQLGPKGEQRLVRWTSLEDVNLAKGTSTRLGVITGSKTQAIGIEPVYLDTLCYERTSCFATDPNSAIYLTRDSNAPRSLDSVIAMIMPKRLLDKDNDVPAFAAELLMLKDCFNVA